MADRILYYLTRWLIRLIQSFPLLWVARFGRGVMHLAYYVDARHRRMAQRNLSAALGDTLSPLEVRRLALENMRRLGENCFCAIKTAAMSIEQIRTRVEFVGLEGLRALSKANPASSAVGAVGHFGNFELYAHMAHFVDGFRGAATYRGLGQPALDWMVQELRETSGCLFFERRSEASALKAEMSRGGLLLGLLADQHAGDGGLPLPFFGRVCSTNPAPAVFALRYRAPLFVAICYRVELARWRVEVSPFITTHSGGKARPIMDIMGDVNKHYEQAIRRDPANWFWVHNRWKEMKPRRVSPASRSPQESLSSEEAPG